MLIFKHDTKIQLVISAVLQGLQMGGTFASQMTILADSCTMENFAGATSGYFFVESYFNQSQVSILFSAH